MVTAADIEMTLRDELWEDENEPDSSGSDTEDEIIEEENHSSDSEQSAEGEADLVDEEASQRNDLRFYIGKDGKWFG